MTSDRVRQEAVPKARVHLSILGRTYFVTTPYYNTPRGAKFLKMDKRVLAGVLKTKLACPFFGLTRRG